MVRGSRERAFTVIEMVIVLVIVGLLLAIAIPQFGRVKLEAVAAPDSVVGPNASGTMTVRATSWRRGAVPGVTVRFEAEGRGGAVTPTKAVTDSAGRATTTWIVREGPSTVTFVAAVEGQRARVTLPVRVSAGSSGPPPPASRVPARAPAAAAPAAPRP